MIPLAQPEINLHRRNTRCLPNDALKKHDEDTATTRIAADDKKPRHRPVPCVLIPLMKVFAIVAMFVLYFAPSKQTTGASTNNPVEMALEIQRNGLDHRVFMFTLRTACVDPVVSLRLVGPEIYAFSPYFANSSDFVSGSGVYKFKFTLDESVLLPGKYGAQATVLKCGHERSVGLENSLFAKKNSSSTFPILERDVIILARDVPPTSDVGAIGMAWIYAPKCDGEQVSSGCTQINQQKQYQVPYNSDDFVFMEVDRKLKRPIYDNGVVTLKDSNMTIGKPHSLRNHENADPNNLLKYFGDLSNYELVCWLGDDDADRYRRAFLELYPLMHAPFQRPFKFHYLRLTDISHPTKSFTETSHHTYRKCKIFFISYGIDRMEEDREMTPESYTREVELLLRHIEMSHPDTTFPAWFLTLRSNSSVSSSRAPDRVHLFNSRLKQFFHSFSRLQTRFQLMDNIDITESLWQTCNDGYGCSNMEKHAAATVGMRCMEKIAMQVKTWRSLNQKGTKDGLMRNGNLIPNPEFVKYLWDNSSIHGPGSE